MHIHNLNEKHLEVEILKESLMFKSINGKLQLFTQTNMEMKENLKLKTTQHK